MMWLLMFTIPHLQPAQQALRLARSLASGDPTRYQQRWSEGLIPPCPQESDDGPCGDEPFVPPGHQAMPSVLLTVYQDLNYQPLGLKKARLSVSWTFTLVASGVVWKITVTSRGLRHDLFLNEYETHWRQIDPLTRIR